MQIKEIVGKRFERTATIERGAIDEKKRTVALSFSSEEPYERWWGAEILDHSAGAMIMNRLLNGAPLLVGHTPEDQVGVIEDVSIGADRKGRAVVRFGRSQRAEEIFQDVIDKIRRNVSVGYIIHKMILEKEEDGFETYRVTSWEPLEISIVPIPADLTVGVGRSATERKNHMEKFESEDQGAKRPRQIQRELRQEVADIMSLAQRFGMTSEAGKHIENGRSLDQFKQLILDRTGQDCASIRVNPTEDGGNIGLSGRELGSYSVVKLLRAAILGRENPAFMNEAGLELEAHRAAVQQHQRMGLPASRGLLIPNDILGAGGWARRDLSVGVATAGGNLVATNLLSGSFIDVLRNLAVVMSMGAQPLPDLVGSVAIPRKTSGSSAGWIATEGGNVSQSEPAFDQVTMSPKTLGSYAEITRNLLLQSSLQVENLVRFDLAAGVATAIDLAALYGSAANGQPRGVANQTGINAPTAFAAAVPTFAEIVAMESAVAVDNALVGSLGYIIEPSMRGSFKTTAKFANTGFSIWEPGNTVNGYQAGVSSQITSGDVFFGNWADLLIGFWGGLDVVIDPYTNSLSGTVRVVVHQSCDIAVRHPVSFAYNNDGV